MEKTQQRLSIEEYKALQKGIKPNKYRAVRTEYGGRRYDSKKEAAFAAKLDLLLRAGEIKFWIPQVSMPVGANNSTRYVADFLVGYPDGGFRLIDVKGKDTPMSRQKRKTIRENYGIEVELR
ncbi:MAG: DUF1064 domain-containing protein [Candidatus Omnitrophota bacterium]